MRSLYRQIPTVKSTLPRGEAIRDGPLMLGMGIVSSLPGPRMLVHQGQASSVETRQRYRKMSKQAAAHRRLG
jgi:hypothetical protein